MKRTHHLVIHPWMNTNICSHLHNANRNTFRLPGNELSSMGFPTHCPAKRVKTEHFSVSREPTDLLGLSEALSCKKSFLLEDRELRSEIFSGIPSKNLTEIFQKSLQLISSEFYPLIVPRTFTRFPPRFSAMTTWRIQAAPHIFQRTSLILFFRISILN